MSGWTSGTHMCLIAGVDGCKAGWIALIERVPAGQIDSAVSSTPRDLCRSLAGARVIAVDVPIGLTDRGPRVCDAEARRCLGRQRASSVFPPSIRPALGATTREDASEIQEKIDGRRIGVQAWGILPKIREWDSCLRADAQIAKQVFEVHPEVCFRALSGFKPMRYGKKTPEGRHERHESLVHVFGAKVIDENRSCHARRDVTDDDLYDAFAALWTARRIHAEKASCLPESPPFDSEGLPMGIWY